MSITKLSPNWACQMGPIHCPKFLLPGYLRLAFHSFIHSIIHSFIRCVYTAPLRGDYSFGRPWSPIKRKRTVLPMSLCRIDSYDNTHKRRESLLSLRVK